MEQKIDDIRKQGNITFANVVEIDNLNADLERQRIVHERLLKEREGKQIFTLFYQRGTPFQEVEDLEKIRSEIWAFDPTEAAEFACKEMINSETEWVLTDAQRCRLDVFIGDQTQDHEAILINPYGIAPSQQSDGGPLGFAENVFKALTGLDADLSDGTVQFLEE